MAKKVYLGTSGYQYKHWKGDFYPEDLPVSQWFKYYSRYFDTVEINNTFYKMADADTFAEWRKAALKGFSYAIKYSRFGTHLKKLKEPEGHINYFLDRALHLEKTLGSILVQLPPNWNRNLRRLREFLEITPQEFRWAIEVRDPSWLCQELYDLLREKQVALVIHDMIPDHPQIVTTDWTYLRFHGKNYGGSYSEAQLESIADTVRDHTAENRDVYIYFNNDLGGHAVRNAMNLKEKLDL